MQLRANPIVYARDISSAATSGVSRARKVEKGVDHFPFPAFT